MLLLLPAWRFSILLRQRLFIHRFPFMRRLPHNVKESSHTIALVAKHWKTFPA